MRAFRYARATDPGEAATLVAGEPDAVYLGGGTNLVDLMKLGVLRPGLVVDVSRLPYDADRAPPGRRRADRRRGPQRPGRARPRASAAATRRWPGRCCPAAPGRSAARPPWPATSCSAPAARTSRTPRTPCNKREPGSGCSAIPGAHRDLGVIGTSDACVATHPSDLAVALAAYDAVVEVRRPDGIERLVPIDDLHRLPGDTPVDRDRARTGRPGHRCPAARAAGRRGGDLPQGARPLVLRVRRRSRSRPCCAAGRRPDRRGPAGARRRRAETVAAAGHRADCWPAPTRATTTCGRRPARRSPTPGPLPENAFKLELAADLVAAVLRDLRTAGASR